MTLTRRQVACLLGSSLIVYAANTSAATDWPSRSVKIIVPYVAGVSADVVTRLIAERLGARLNQSVVVDNKPGASGIIGTSIAARSAPDGYTMLLTTETIMGVVPQVFSRPQYDPFKSFTPILQVATMPWYLVVGPQQPYQSLAELIEAARKAPGKLSYGSQGIGSGGQVRMAMLNTMAGVSMAHAPYSTSPIVDVIAGQLSCAFEPTASAIPMIRSGKVRALGITSLQRSSALTQVPTIGETLPGYDADGWLGLHLPAGTPQEIVTQLTAHLQAVIQDPAFVSQLREFGGRVTGTSGADFLKVTVDEHEAWGRVIKANNIKVES